MINKYELVKGNNWKIVGKKFSKAVVYVAIAGLVSVYGNSEWYLSIAPILIAGENILTHSIWWNS